jgi:hypothetical protein
MFQCLYSLFVQFQDYELDDMKGVVIEKPAEFDPNQPLQHIQVLELNQASVLRANCAPYAALGGS